MNNKSRPFRCSKPERSFLLGVLVVFSFIGFSQNQWQQQISDASITTISINGNQIFNISVATSATKYITVTSTLDGEYQNDFQLVVKEEGTTLNLGLEQVLFSEILDDKRNAHKVIAATLEIEIPEHLSLYIVSDIGSAVISGDFDTLYVELLQGSCKAIASAKTGTINTIDGAINVVTKNALVIANSNHGTITTDKFYDTDSVWKLTSIKGDITVQKPN